MAKNNAIVLGIVVVVVVAAAAAYFVINNGDDKDKTPTMGVGDSMTFLVFGTYEDSDNLIDGTMTFKLVDENDTQYKFETETAMYDVDSTGKRTPTYIGKDAEWEDKDSDDDDFVDNGKLTVSTFWGEKTLQYAKSEDGNSHILYNGDIIYAMMVEYDDSTLYYELTDCSLIKEKKVNRDVHDVSISMDARTEYNGITFIGNLTYGLDNTETEVFKKMKMDYSLYAENDPSISYTKSTKGWYGPFNNEGGMVKVGTESINTTWGYKETDVYKKSESGNTSSLYSYKDVPVRMVFEQNGIVMTFDASSIVVDGKSVTLDEAAAL